MKKFIACLSIITMLSACQKDLSGTTIKDSATGAKVLEGKIIDAHAVKVKSADKLQDNSLGMVGGGIAGGVGGSAFGKGTGNTGATVLGAIAGAAVGALIQDQLGTQDAMEYLVKIDKKYLNDIKISKRVNVGSKDGVDDDMARSADISTKTDIIAVVQDADPALTAGKRVYIIYHDDRPRLTAQ